MVQELLLKHLLCLLLSIGAHKYMCRLYYCLLSHTFFQFPLHLDNIMHRTGDYYISNISNIITARSLLEVCRCCRRHNQLEKKTMCQQYSGHFIPSPVSPYKNVPLPFSSASWELSMWSGDNNYNDFVNIM